MLRVLSLYSMTYVVFMSNKQPLYTKIKVIGYYL
jgi:hypothetical protein